MPGRSADESYAAIGSLNLVLQSSAGAAVCDQLAALPVSVHVRGNPPADAAGQGTPEYEMQVALTVTNPAATSVSLTGLHVPVRFSRGVQGWEVRADSAQAALDVAARARVTLPTAPPPAAQGNWSASPPADFRLLCCARPAAGRPLQSRSRLRTRLAPEDSHTTSRPRRRRIAGGEYVFTASNSSSWRNLCNTTIKLSARCCGTAALQQAHTLTLHFAPNVRALR